MYLKSHYPQVDPYPESNAHHVLLGRPEQKLWPDHILHVDAVTGRKRTYKQFLKRVHDGMSALAGQGGLGLRGEDGEMVGILSENCMDYIVLIHSLLAITTPFALLPSYSTPYELVHAVRLAKVTRLFVAPRLVPLGQRVCKECGIPDANIYVLEGHVEGRPSFASMIECAQRDRLPEVAVQPAKRDTLAYIVFSSGTSGPPKGVMISHDNLIFTFMQAVTVSQVISASEPPKRSNTIPISLSFLPIHHTFGLHVYCFRSFMDQNTQIILPKWDMELALKIIAEWRVTVLALVPSLVHSLVNYPNPKRINLSSLDRVICGAAYLPPELAEKLAKIAPKDMMLRGGYGMSELTLGAISEVIPGVIFDRIGKLPRGSTGILSPGMEARILREDGTETGVNESGILWLRGRNVALGYFKDEKATRETFVDGWLRTGDRFRADEKGFFFFQDRAKDTLKVSGMQVAPLEIENVMFAQPDNYITDVAVAGVRSGRISDELVPRAWIVLSVKGKEAGLHQVMAALDAWTRRHLSKYKWLRGGIEIVDEIPKSPTGKVLRRILQDRHNSNGRLEGKL